MSGFRVRILRLIENRWVRPVVLIPVAVYCIALFWFLQDKYSLFGFTLDDAWIHRVYARSLSLGQGFAYNEGVQEAGFTSPLWIIITAPMHWAEPLGTNSVVLLVKCMGALLGLAAVLATAILARRLSGSEWIGCLAASLFALEPRLLFSALSGMETILLVALWTWICVALLQERFVLSLVLFSLAPVTRPESVLILPFSVLAMIFLIHRKGVTVLTLAVCVISIVPMLLWMLFCQNITGHWLPNTYYLKAKGFTLGLSQVQIAWSAVSQHGFASLYIYLLGLAACVTLYRPERRFAIGVSLLMLVLAPVIYILGVVGTREISLTGYYWTRWIDPASLILTIPFCLGCSYVIGLIVRPDLLPLWTVRGVWHRGKDHRNPPATGRAPMRSGGRSKSRRVKPRTPRPQEVLSNEIPVSGRWFLANRAVGIVVLLLLVMSIPEFTESFNNRRRQLSSDSRAIDIINVGMGKWIRDHTSEDAIVAVNDAGAIRYFGRRYTIDLLGLNNTAIAFGGMNWLDVLVKADWVAIFPGWFSGTIFMEELHRTFEPRFEIRIPLKEYTVCASQAQTIKVAYQKRVQPLIPAAANMPSF